MQKVFTSFVCAAAALVAACDSGASDTDLITSGPPMIRQVRLVELYTDATGATNLQRRVFAFGTHPDATPDDEHPVTTALPGNAGGVNGLRIIMDQLLEGNTLEEISCRGQVDDDSWGSVPVNATPDDIARCSVPQDVLPSSCPGSNPNSVCICQRAAGCIVGTDTVMQGDPVGVLDANQDGAADDTRFIQGAVGIRCNNTIDVPIDLQASFWEPSGDQEVPARGGFDVLGPAVVLVPTGALPTGATCGVVFDPSVVDKQGLGVCAPPGGDYTVGCTPGDTSQFHFGVEVLEIDVQGVVDGQTDVSPTDAIIGAANAPLDMATLTDTPTTISLAITQGNVDVPLTIMPINGTPPSGFRANPTTPPLLSNTMYTLTIGTGVHDTFGQSQPAVEVIHFTTGM